MAALTGDGLFVQEEEFADTGYQVAPADQGASSGGPADVKQLGALTAEDFYRKPGAAKDESRLVLASLPCLEDPVNWLLDHNHCCTLSVFNNSICCCCYSQHSIIYGWYSLGYRRAALDKCSCSTSWSRRRLFQPQSARAGQPGAAGTQPPAPLPPRPQQRPPPPQAAAVRPGTSPPPPPPPPPSSARPPAMPQPTPAMQTGYAALPPVPAEPAGSRSAHAIHGAPPVPPPPPTSRPPPPRAAPPPPPPPPVPKVRHPSFHEPMLSSMPESSAVIDEPPSRPSYEMWGVDEPPPPHPSEELSFGDAPSMVPPPPPVPPIAAQVNCLSVEQRHIVCFLRVVLRITCLTDWSFVLRQMSVDVSRTGVS